MSWPERYTWEKGLSWTRSERNIKYPPHNNKLWGKIRGVPCDLGESGKGSAKGLTGKFEVINKNKIEI